MGAARLFKVRLKNYFYVHTALSIIRIAMKYLSRSCCLLICACILFGCSHPEADQPVTNVLVIVGDDHSAGVTGCYGNKLIRTPNIDRLAADGILFGNAYANAPVCSASRQSVLTGKYPHSTGVTLLTTPFPDEGNVTIAEYLRERGYMTGVVGKTHFNHFTGPVPDHGFTHSVTHADYRQWLDQQDMPAIPDSIETLPDWKPFRDPARIWLNADMLPTAVWESYGSAAFDAMKAIEFLEAQKDTSFFLWVGFHEPHSPFNFPVEYAGKYDPADMPLPEGSPEDDRFVPEIFRTLSDEDKRGIIASYYTSVEYMDQQIGKILDAVGNLGLQENTLVVYFGDQGYLLGDHKRFEKHTMWDPALKAPLIFRAGDRKVRRSRNEALVQFIDIVPTILDLIGQPALESVQGRSLEYLFDSRSEEGNEYVFSEFLEDNKAMITDGKWKYVFTTGKYDLGQGYQTGEGPSGILHKLYDLQNDPDETMNIAELPGNETILASLQQHMIDIFKNTHPAATSVSDTLSVEEQLVWFCEPPDRGAKRGVK